MAKQTKSERLETMYRQARMDLPEHMFKEFLCFAWGIFEAVARFGRPIHHGDISIIEKELKNRRKECGFLEDLLEVDREVEKEFQRYRNNQHRKLEGKVVQK